MWKTYPQNRWISACPLVRMCRTYEVQLDVLWEAVDNLWKSYPPILWKTLESRQLVWIVWKSYPQNRWITGEKDVLTQQVMMTDVENLSTKPVDNSEMLPACVEK
ncbi:hypothetical protein KTAU_32620 [Thermogemmatispora aurantia]|uniref:Uncharacterized protein n=1 Tax=Thermogemmatispora aurantia TaxID=2045279 RepID=A0A5J4KFE1_9CHLR|nr:hypothetical protein KTAU_32620 [Thermogemmatispora aurantia]